MTRFIKKRSDKKEKTSRKEKLPPVSISDITMCKGGKCPFKTMCYRYTALPNELYQSFFIKPPFKIDKGMPSCEMFWGDAANRLLIMLIEIMGGKYEQNKKISKTTSEKRKRNSKRK